MLGVWGLVLILLELRIASARNFCSSGFYMRVPEPLWVLIRSCKV